MFTNLIFLNVAKKTSLYFSFEASKKIRQIKKKFCK